MTSRRVPPSSTEFVSGPAEKMLARLWAPARRLLEDLQEAVQPPSWWCAPNGHIWLAGGAVRAALTGEVPRDLDFFCPLSSMQRDAVAHVKARYDHQVLVNGNVVTKLNVLLSVVDDDGEVEEGVFWTGVDFVKRYGAKPLDTARAMDFVMCAGALSTTSYARHLRFEEDTAARQIAVNAPWAPRLSLRRMERFVQRGWTVSPEARARLQALTVTVVYVLGRLYASGHLERLVAWIWGVSARRRNKSSTDIQVGDVYWANEVLLEVVNEHDGIYHLCSLSDGQVDAYFTAAQLAKVERVEL